MFTRNWIASLAKGKSIIIIIIIIIGFNAQNIVNFVHYFLQQQIFHSSRNEFETIKKKNWKQNVNIFVFLWRHTKSCLDITLVLFVPALSTNFDSNWWECNLSRLCTFMTVCKYRFKTEKKRINEMNRRRREKKKDNEKQTGYIKKINGGDFVNIANQWNGRLHH